MEMGNMRCIVSSVCGFSISGKVRRARNTPLDSHEIGTYFM